MKKKIAVLGSTGSLGKILCNYISKNLNMYNVILLVANKNSSQLINQAKKLNAKNIIIYNKETFKKLSNKKLKFNIFNSIDDFQKNNKGKFLDYTLAAISGLNGLDPTFKIIKNSKVIAIANKESIICAWNLIEKELKKFKTKFIPVDSEHFTSWFSLKDKKVKIKRIFLTASGGPFLNTNRNNKNSFTLSKALDHPNWKMGSKITIDSSTMMNKVFEIIEAKNIFNLRYDNLLILTHPKSYIHSIILYENGIFELVGHETNMKIPIINSILNNRNFKFKNLYLDLNKLNDLDLKIIDEKKFPTVKILKQLPKNTSLFETIIVSLNDTLVELFLSKKINFFELNNNLLSFLKKKEFTKYKKKKPHKIKDILNLANNINLKVNKMLYKNT
jgi:1-deoxy-D-xylulose-5-phosphate reductoisomerase